MPRKIAERVLIVCPVCKKSFVARASRHRKYHNKECKNQALQGRQDYKVEISKEDLRRLYFDEQKTLKEIGDMYRVTKTTIRRRFKDFGFTPRTSGEGKSIFLQNNPDQNPFAREDVKQKILPSKSTDHNKEEKRKSMKNVWQGKTEDERKEWGALMTEGRLRMTPTQKYEALVKQFDTKRKNGTFNCSGLENKVAESLDAKGVIYDREFIIPEGKRRYRFDFRVGQTLIEVQGTGTHADPNVFNASDVIKLGLKSWKPRKASTIWRDDEKKKEYAERLGYKVEYIWESQL